MCSSLINQICIEVMKTECTTSISVMFLPLMSFVSLYDKSNENEIKEMIKQIENEKRVSIWIKNIKNLLNNKKYLFISSFYLLIKHFKYFIYLIQLLIKQMINILNLI